MNDLHNMLILFKFVRGPLPLVAIEAQRTPREIFILLYSGFSVSLWQKTVDNGPWTTDNGPWT